jgi:hypothetical protein
MTNLQTRSQASLEECGYPIRENKMTEEKKLKLVTEVQSEFDAKKRDVRVFELRIQGNTFEQIATEVGYSGPSGAWQAYQRVKSECIYESMDESRQLELMRLDDLQVAVWDRAINGELPAAHCVLKIMDRRAKLLGLDKPEKVEVNKWDFNAEDLDAEVQRIVTMMNEREDQFMERREAEVRKEMRSQFEIEKRLEKELAAKENVEDARAALLKMLNRDSEEKNK